MKRGYLKFLSIGIFSILFVAASCGGGGGVHRGSRTPAIKGQGYAVASWYGKDFHGKLTASGERYDMYGMTCAHKEFPLGTRLKVTGVESGKSAVITVNDRGPFVRGREIDLSVGAAKEIGLYGPGTGRVRYSIVGYDEKYRKYIKAEVPETAEGPFTIQAGSFEDIENAAHLKASLKVDHSGVHVARTMIKGRWYYRVRVGKFSAFDDAHDYAKRLADEGYNAVIMSYE